MHVASNDPLSFRADLARVPGAVACNGARSTGNAYKTIGCSKYGLSAKQQTQVEEITNAQMNVRMVGGSRGTGLYISAVAWWWRHNTFDAGPSTVKNACYDRVSAFWQTSCEYFGTP